VRVFLSSTTQDLGAYRQAADDALLKLAHESVIMERFGPLPNEPVAECERRARESDVVVCIVAHRYGYVPEPGKGSITRREVEAAKEARREVLVWIVDDDHPWPEAKESDLLADPLVLADDARVAEVVQSNRELQDFKSWLRRTFVVETFTTPDDLKTKVTIALAKRAMAPVASAARRAVRPSRRGQIRIVHALQPAPHFGGRDELVAELTAWVENPASVSRVWSLVAVGGTGKTAVAERVVRDMAPGQTNVLVWSFYHNPDVDAFLRECNQLFLDEDDGPVAGRLERLERRFRDGDPHLLVLDGLERVQEDAGRGYVRGELSDHTLKLLLQTIAAGLGRTRALVTSRFPLVDLHDWAADGSYRDTPLDDLTPEAAVGVLRGWEVTGDEAALRAAAAQVGNHALSVAVIGSYLRSFARGSIDAVSELRLDVDDPKGAKLARVLAYYAQRLPSAERALLARLSVFPRGVTRDLLDALVDAGGVVAGELARARPRLAVLLGNLQWRGLVFEYRSDTKGASVTWTAHPFLREGFRALLDCAEEQVYDTVAGSLRTGLDARPAAKPVDPAVLDRYERLVEATRLAGQEQQAFELYWYGMGAYAHLGKVLGEYERGFRILAALFASTDVPTDARPRLSIGERSSIANDLSLFASRLGRLAEARRVRQMDDRWKKSLRDPRRMLVGLQNSSHVACALGWLPECRQFAESAVVVAEMTDDPRDLVTSVAYRANAAHAMGDMPAANADFALATMQNGGPLYSLAGCYHVRHHIDRGAFAAARALYTFGLTTAHAHGWNDKVHVLHALAARLDLATRADPTPHLAAIRDWTSRTGDMQYIVEAHLLTALHLLASGDPQGALGEAEVGLLPATSCGYGLLRIELLIARARIYLVWPDVERAQRAARDAFELSVHSAYRYAWGEADAAQLLGEAHIAANEPAAARRVFTRARDVRRRIEHPGLAETERWIARLG